MSNIRYSQLDLEDGSDDAIIRRTDSIESQVDEQLGEGFSPQSDVIQPESGRYPYCIVWTPLPLITYAGWQVSIVCVCVRNSRLLLQLSTSHQWLAS